VKVSSGFPTKILQAILLHGMCYMPRPTHPSLITSD